MKESISFSLNGRQLSWLSSAFLLILCVVFIAGYFLGQQQAVARFMHNVEQDSFSDHIYAALCNLEQTGKRDGQDGLLETQEEIEYSTTPTSSTLLQPDTSTCAEQASEIEAPCEYYAQLIGFGTKKAAQKFVDRLQKKGLPVFVKERRSRTARGIIRLWYQVCTETFQEKDKLAILVDALKREERLTDVYILTR